MAAIAVSFVWTSCAAQSKDFKEIELSSQNGGQMKLSETVRDNKYTFLVFWASWCGPCMREVPFQVEAYKKYKDKGFEIYGVSLDDDPASWRATTSERGMSWIQVSDLAGWASPAASQYGVRSIPTNFLIDRKGNIVAKNLRGGDLEAKLSELLK